MPKSKAFLWSSLLLLFALVSCEDDEPKIWDVYYQVVLESGTSGEYRVTYSGSTDRSVQAGGLTESVWESPIQAIEESKVVSMKFERLSGQGNYRIRIYVGGSHVSEASVPVNIDEEEISYSIPRA